MKKRISVLLVLSILLFSVMQTVSVKADTTSNVTVSDPNLFKHIPLSDSAIKSNWPNLPTAQMLWNSTDKFYINTDEIGQVDSSGPFSPSSPVQINTPQFANYTVDTPDTLTGGIIHNEPIIWLQYNSTLWLEVPINQLMATQNPTSALVISSTPLSTWAIGLYANPAQIANSYPVGGAMSYGQLGQYIPPNSQDYLYSDILTIDSGATIMQIGMCYSDIYGSYVCIQGYYASNNAPAFGPIPYQEPINFNQFYNEYIRSSSNSWQFYWNQEYIGSWSDGQTTMITGNQPNVCAESDDYSTTGSGFANCNYQIGEVYNQQYFLAAVGYLYGGNWVPFNLNDPIPSAYVYYGGQNLGDNTFYVANSGPEWLGEQTANMESLQIGYNVPVPGMNSQLW